MQAAEVTLARLVRALDSWDAEMIRQKVDLERADAADDELRDARVAAAAYLHAVAESAS